MQASLKLQVGCVMKSEMEVAFVWLYKNKKIASFFLTIFTLQKRVLITLQHTSQYS